MLKRFEIEAKTIEEAEKSDGIIRTSFRKNNFKCY